MIDTAVMRVRCICRKAAKCQPNFRKAVRPDPTKSCGPYRPLLRAELSSAALHRREEGASHARGASQEEDFFKRELLHHSKTGLPPLFCKSPLSMPQSHWPSCHLSYCLDGFDMQMPLKPGRA